MFIGIGLAAGFFSALFGVGGGTVIVPLLILLAGFAAAESTATSLAAIGLTAFFGMIAFGILGEVNWGYAALVGVPAMAGTFGGTWLQQPGVVAPARRALQRLALRDRRAPLPRMTVALAIVLGLAAGVLSGMFGVGGGILFVPTLSLVVGLSHLEAQATSLAAIIPVAAVGRLAAATNTATCGGVPR